MNRSLTIILLLLLIGGIGVAMYAAKKKAAPPAPTKPVAGDPPRGDITVIIDRKPIIEDTTAINDK